MITFDEFKTYLQLTDDSLEPLFLTYEPLVESDVLDITNKNFNQASDVSFSKGSTVLSGGYFYDQDLFVGAEVIGDGIPDNTSVYNWSLGSLTIDKFQQVQKIILLLFVLSRHKATMPRWFFITKTNTSIKLKTRY